MHDVRSLGFAAEAHRQSVPVAAADRGSDDIDFVEAVSDDWNESGAGTSSPSPAVPTRASRGRCCAVDAGVVIGDPSVTPVRHFGVDVDWFCIKRCVPENFFDER